MIFFTPRFLTEAKLLQTTAKKLFNYHCDLWSDTQYQEATASLQQLDSAIKSKNKETVATARSLVEKVFTQLVPQRRFQSLTENIEAIIIAIVLAVGFQAYLLKPFKIPTGSMQPTLFGMTGHPELTAAPNVIKRSFDFIALGRSYIDVPAHHEEEVLGLEEHTWLNFFTFTTIITTHGKETIFAPRDVVVRDFNVTPGRFYNAGEMIAQGYVQAGDQIFVDRMSYAFRKPKAADVFVFLTTGIRGIEMNLDPKMGSEYYVKRLAGLPGNTLRINPPQLFINGHVAEQAPFQRVMSEKNGYRGYSNASENGIPGIYLSSPDETFTVPTDSYFALGDNSFNSSDSRYWGIVPEQNVVGRAFFVYWPFSSRWGLIH